MGETFVDRIPLWCIFAFGAGVSWLAWEVGDRIGKWWRGRTSQTQDSPANVAVAAILALLGFMMAFTFNYASMRYESRRQVVLDEANAIRTSYLRSRLLMEPQRSESERLLKDYVRIRLPNAEGSFSDLSEIIRSSELIHQGLWSQAVAAFGKAPPTTQLYVQSVNDVVNLHAKRVLYALNSRIPMILWGSLLVLAILSIGATGYLAGVSASGRSPATAALILSFSSVLYLVADLDRPVGGAFTTNQAAMLDLYESMATNEVAIAR